MNFTLVNFWGTCLALDIPTNSLVISLQCDQFVFTEENRIRHLITGKCIAPESLSTNAKIVGTSDCAEMDSIFQYTDVQQLKHVATGHCMQPSVETDNPSTGTNYVIRQSCPDLLRTRLIFNFTGTSSFSFI